MSPSSSTPVLAVEGLTIAAKGGSAIVQNLGFSLKSGEIGALVGESGSGKTTVGRAILRLLSPALSVTAGSIRFEGHDLVQADAGIMRNLRGRRIGAVFQEPMVSLNPSLTVGRQMMEALLLHEAISRREARARCLDMLERVRISDPLRCFNDYPGKFSGGMRQRFMLASVLSTRPSLLIADEPTTALDAIIRKEIMDQMVELVRELGTTVLLISHDLAMLSQYSDTTTVLKGGQIVEHGDTRDTLLHPRTTYMREFVAALPKRPASSSAETAEDELVSVTNLDVTFRTKPTAPFAKGGSVWAVQDVSFDVRRGEVVAVVGESGSGKTTLGRTLAGLNLVTSGTLDGPCFIDSQAKAVPRIQMIFQDSHSSLDPQMTLESIVAEPLRQDRSLTNAERLARAREALEEVGLPASFCKRYVHELSGGQRQRVGIARAVVSHPALVVADEPVSALDVSVQRQVLNLLAQMRSTYGLSYLFISHDLSVVEEIADRVLVMYRGRLVEAGTRESIFERPRHPYTRRLLEATPRIFHASDDTYELAIPSTEFSAAPDGFIYYEPDSANGGGLAQMVQIDQGHQVLCTRVAGLC
ncbi:dipeptide ABC transporter ATP-binding protein [Sphingosinicella sp.]|uniref:dipeptide ABC transporter ATP-binding protein n=1 Tax=Sphingosinicella sp. TaxID=1917971 RepID=UPI0035B22FFA